MGLRRVNVGVSFEVCERPVAVVTRAGVSGPVEEVAWFGLVQHEKSPHGFGSESPEWG